ncbi:hypothetical protein EV143_102332 [Flavobacterium chryseum]|nr:hypothetical protein EV143_102332 [Flavobacterium sp. P3160]
MSYTIISFSERSVSKFSFLKVSLSGVSSSQAINNLYPIENIIGPTNKPINPHMINPPITPRKITSMGTIAPLPNKSGFKILSESPLMIKNIVQQMA